MSLAVRLLSLNDVVLMLLLTALFVLFGAGGLLAVRRYVPAATAGKNNETVSAVFHTVGAVYAVLLAFVVLVCWQEYDRTKENIAREVSSAVVLMRDLEAYPDAAAAALLKEEYLRYIESVMRYEWPAMGRREEHFPTVRSFDRFFKRVNGITPRAPKEEVLWREILDTLEQLAELRSLRLNAVADEIPASLWTVMLAGAFITIGLTFLFGTEHFAAHVLSTSLLAASIALIIYTIIALDHPFSGYIRIGPEGFSRVFEIAAL